MQVLDSSCRRVDDRNTSKPPKASMNYRQRRRLSDLVSKIARGLQVEPSVVVHFIIADLDRIYRARLLEPEVALQRLNAEIHRLKEHEATLQVDLRRKEKLIDATSSRIASASATIESKSAALAKSLQEIARLKERLAELDASLRAATKTESKLKYDVMMKAYSRREHTETSARVNRLILSIFLLVAVAIAAALAWKLLE
jgi:DNA repair exonuclease SbcCD ATPase subunit